jgi:hypothetical protein
LGAVDQVTPITTRSRDVGSDVLGTFTVKGIIRVLLHGNAIGAGKSRQSRVPYEVNRLISKNAKNVWAQSLLTSLDADVWAITNACDVAYHIMRLDVADELLAKWGDS